MDDIIPFLIVIAISIIGAAARSKKKRDAGGNITPSTQNRKSDELFSWLEKLTGEEEQVIPYSEPVKQQMPVNLSQPVENKKIIEPYKKQVSQYTGFISPKETQELIEKEGTRSTNNQINKNNKLGILKQNRNKLKSGFNLKKAVIYTEILNRKYN